MFKRIHLDKVMRDVCVKLGVADKITPHDLRRSWTTIAAKLGANRQTLDRILNHADNSVTGGVYDQYRYEREDAALMERVASHILALAEGREAAIGNVVSFNK